VLSGVVRPSHGRGRLDGHDLTALPPHRIARAGLARTFQNLRLFGSLPVLEHLLIVYGGRRRGRERALALLADVGLTGAEDRYPGELAYGEQRRLELARALALDPRVILLDEPLAGLPASESDELLDLFARMRDGGTTLLLVEHDVPSVLRISDRVVVLDHGRLLADGPPAKVAADPAVRRAYLGDGDE